MLLSSATRHSRAETGGEVQYKDWKFTQRFLTFDYMYTVYTVEYISFFGISNEVLLLIRTRAGLVNSKMVDQDTAELTSAPLSVQLPSGQYQRWLDTTRGSLDWS